MASVQGDKGVATFGVISSRPGFMLHAEVQGKQVIVPVDEFTQNFVYTTQGGPTYIPDGLRDGVVTNGSSRPDYPNFSAYIKGDNNYIFHTFTTKTNDKFTKNGVDYRFLDCMKNTTGVVSWNGKEINLAGLNTTTNAAILVSVTTNTNGWASGINPTQADVDLLNAAIKYRHANFYAATETTAPLGEFTSPACQVLKIVDCVALSDGSISWAIVLLKTEHRDYLYDASKTYSILAPVPIVMATRYSNGFQVNIGGANVVMGERSVCVGDFNVALDSVIFGENSTAQDKSICVGISNKCTSSCVVAGHSVYAIGDYCVGIGTGLIIGRTWDNGSGSQYFKNAQVGLGNYNKFEKDAFLCVGDGGSSTNRSNVMTIGRVAAGLDSVLKLADADHHMFQASLPKPPTAAGSYKLRCSVGADGSATYSWAVDDGDMVMLGIAPPTTKPAFAGQLFVDANNKKLYVAKAATAASDWVAIG